MSSTRINEERLKHPEIEEQNWIIAEKIATQFPHSNIYVNRTKDEEDADLCFIVMEWEWSTIFVHINCNDKTIIVENMFTDDGQKFTYDELSKVFQWITINI